MIELLVVWHFLSIKYKGEERLSRMIPGIVARWPNSLYLHYTYWDIVLKF